MLPPPFPLSCPVGVATQDPELRRKFTGTPEHVQNFFFLLAEGVRSLMASLGVRRLEDLVGRTDLLKVDRELLAQNPTLAGLRLENTLLRNTRKEHPGVDMHFTTPQDHGLEHVLDQTLIDKASLSLGSKPRRSFIEMPIRNTDRAVGTLLSHKVTKRFGPAFLPDGTIHVRFSGSAGQSFGAFLCSGITFELEGDANDYVANGLCGGRVIVHPPRAAAFNPEQNILLGNVALYGATSGEAYFQGQVGERFCVRNSGAIAVVEGCGDHGCEYMTGGRVVILGRVGRNFAAGMSGGIAYVWDVAGDFRAKCNRELVGLETVEVADDVDELYEILQQYRRHTRSPLGERVLARWPGIVDEFVKVMPHDYKKALDAKKARAAAAALLRSGVDEPQEEGKQTRSSTELPPKRGDSDSDPKALVAPSARSPGSSPGSSPSSSPPASEPSSSPEQMASPSNTPSSSPPPSDSVVRRRERKTGGDKQRRVFDGRSANEASSSSFSANGGRRPGRPNPGAEIEDIRLPDSGTGSLSSTPSDTPRVVPARSRRSTSVSASSTSTTPASSATSVPISARPAIVEQPDKRRGFIAYERSNIGYRPAQERVGDWEEIAATLEPKLHAALLKTQSARCMDCGVPFCHQSHSGCPLSNRIPEFNAMVHRGDWRAALDILLSTNPFPEFTGSVCPAPCEGACVLGIIDNPVSIKNIEYSIIDRAFQEGWMKPQPPHTRTGRTVAVVGSGPAGLAAATVLNQLGHSVTVFERADRIGGLMMYGVPNMKCDKAVVQRRVDLMAAEGVKFVTNTEVGVDIQAAELEQAFDAVLLTVGSTVPRDTPGGVANRQLKNIHFVMDFLRANTKSLLDSKFADGKRIDVAGKDVICIGGGDSGADTIATALRQGAKSVVNFEIMPQRPDERAEDNPWPQWPNVFRVDYAHAEAKEVHGKDPRVYCISTEAFVDDGHGHVSGIKTVDVEWERDEKTGRFTMKKVDGSDRVWKADHVILAMGFLHPEATLPTALGLETDGRSNIKANTTDFKTSKDGVFAAGDCRRGQSLVVWAIAEGRDAAAQVDGYLMAKEPKAKSSAAVAAVAALAAPAARKTVLV